MAAGAMAIGWGAGAEGPGGCFLEGVFFQCLIMPICPKANRVRSWRNEVASELSGSSKEKDREEEELGV